MNEPRTREDGGILTMMSGALRSPGRARDAACAVGLATLLVLSAFPARPAVAAVVQTPETRPAAAEAAGASDTTAGDEARASRLRIVENGASVELTLEPPSGRDGALRERDAFRVTLDIADAETGEPLDGLFPAAWIDLRRQEDPTAPDACGVKVERYVGGQLRFRPEVDLTSYHLLTLTNTSQIPVIDPMMGFGTSRLYTTIRLPAPGADWALDPDQRTLFVTVPSDDVVSVVDTETWDVVRNLDAGPSPTRIRLGPDGERLWVTNDASESGGLTVIDVGERAVVGRIETGGGPHRIAFAAELDRVFVADAAAGTVSAVDAATLEVVRTTRTGGGPVALDHSPVTGGVYVALAGDGALVELDARSLDERDRIELRPGLHEVAFVPSVPGGHAHASGIVDAMAGRVGFLVNREEDRVHVFDGENLRLLRTVEVFESPDQIAFSSSFAYIRATGSAEITMVPLNDPMSGGVGVFDHFPAGAHRPDEVGDVGVAAAMASAPDMPDAIWIVNPEEEAVYYYHYMEGMPTPSGSLDTYGYNPLAVKLVGRELREVRPGRYTATARLDDPGRYDLVLLTGEPRVVHCFPFDVREDPALRTERVAVRLEPLDGTRFEPGRVEARFRLYDGYTGDPIVHADDVVFLLMATDGWQRRVAAERLGDGLYTLNVTLPDTGVYYLSFASSSLGVSLRDRPPLVLRAAGDPAAASGSSSGEEGRGDDDGAAATARRSGTR